MTTSRRVDEELFYRQARNAYERAQLFAAAKVLWILIPLFGWGLFISRDPLLSILLMLFSLAFAFSCYWRGTVYRRATLVGLNIGLLLAIIPYVAVCFLYESSLIPRDVAIAVCFCVGAVSGWHLLNRTALIALPPHRLRFFGVASVLALSLGALACPYIGVGAITLVLAGALIALAVGFVLKPSLRL